MQRWNFVKDPYSGVTVPSPSTSRPGGALPSRGEPERWDVVQLSEYPLRWDVVHSELGSLIDNVKAEGKGAGLIEKAKPGGKGAGRGRGRGRGKGEGGNAKGRDEGKVKTGETVSSSRGEPEHLHFWHAQRDFCHLMNQRADAAYLKAYFKGEHILNRYY